MPAARSGIACRPDYKTNTRAVCSHALKQPNTTPPRDHPRHQKTLWAAADKLRANVDAAEYKHLVLGLIFLKYISDTFQARRDELTRRFGDEQDDYFLHADADDIAAELEDRDYYKEVNVFLGARGGAVGENLRAQAKQADIGKRIDDALVLIEGENPKLKGILDKRYARAQLPDGKLGELVDLISSIGFGASGQSAKDILGQVYEYFLGQFASAEGKKATSSTPRPASCKRWWQCWRRTTAFMALIMHLLKHDTGRAAVVPPDGFPFGEGAKTTLKRELLERVQPAPSCACPRVFLRPTPASPPMCCSSKRAKPTMSGSLNTRTRMAARLFYAPSRWRSRNSTSERFGGVAPAARSQDNAIRMESFCKKR